VCFPTFSLDVPDVSLHLLYYRRRLCNDRVVVLTPENPIDSIDGQDVEQADSSDWVPVERFHRSWSKERRSANQGLQSLDIEYVVERASEIIQLYIALIKRSIIKRFRFFIDRTPSKKGQGIGVGSTIMLLRRTQSPSPHRPLWN